ncbi:MAG TPA: cytochrome c biogenesis protein CcsA [Planctomycetota bacterium]|nr:cytochrome c biogenesis protein CcsA [Planctomycetota bacterium]
MRYLSFLLLFAATASATPWDEKTVDLFTHLPVQDAGRVKPLSTVASYALLRMNHQRTFRDAEKKSRSPTEWLLEVLFRPDEARQEKFFLVENSAVLDAVGLTDVVRQRRDRYSYEELAPARGRLMQLAHDYDQIKAQDRTPVQSELIDLGQAFLEFERYAQLLDFGRSGDVVKKLEDGSLSGQDAVRLFDGSVALALFPPVDGSDAWLTPQDLVSLALAGHPPAPEHVAMLEALERMASSGDETTFREAAAEFYGRSRQIATTRGEYRKIPLEVSYYKLDAFTKGLVFYILGFVLVAVTWLWPNAWLKRAAIAATATGLAFNATGIVLRCILLGRPPVLNLYDTILFITAVGVLSSLVIEFINRRGIGLAAAPILGSLGMFISNRFELIESRDTLRLLQAVLDTNFWLATHVVCITIGYSAGLLASAIGHVYVIGRIVGLKRGNKSFYRNIARMVYGTLCFALLFSVVGTILGGIWANYSWGRFWGWDPKENGALLIVLAQLALIHAKLDGRLRDLGVSVASILVGGVVSWSWWGVNLLGVGLHSYGFTGGVWTGLITFWSIEGLVLFATLVSWLVSRSAATPPESGATEANPV